MRSLVGTDASALDVNPQAHADVVAGRLRTEHLQRPLEQPRIIAAVVGHRVAVLPGDPDLIRELVGLDEVAPSYLGTVETELRGDEIERALHDEARVRSSGAAIGRGRGGVGIDVAKADAVVRDP